MKELKKDLQSVVKKLKSLTLQTERIAKKLDKLEKPKPAKKLKAKPRAKVRKKVIPKKTSKATAIETVFAIIRRSKKGVSAATLKNKTQFDSKKIYNVINRLKQQGKVKSAGMGVYLKV